MLSFAMLTILASCKSPEEKAMDKIHEDFENKKKRLECEILELSKGFDSLTVCIICDQKEKEWKKEQN